MRWNFLRHLCSKLYDHNTKFSPCRYGQVMLPGMNLQYNVLIHNILPPPETFLKEGIINRKTLHLPHRSLWILACLSCLSADRSAGRTADRQERIG